MKKAFILLSLICFIIYSCSSDSDDLSSTLADFTVIGEDGGSFYELTFDALNNQTNTINLSEQLGLDITNLQEISFTGNIISFYGRSPEGFSAWQKDYNNGVFSKYENYFKNTEEQTAIWNSHSPQHIFVGYESPINSGDAYLRIIDRYTGLFEDTFLISKTRATLIGRPLFYNGKLIITFNEEGTYKSLIYNPVTNTIDDTLVYEGAPNILRNSNGNLSIFDNSNTYFEYDLAVLTKLNSLNLTSQPAFLSFGNLEESFVHNNTVYFRFPAAQPSFLNFYPGIFDIKTQKSSIIDINENINISFEPLQGSRFIPLTMTFDTENEVFLVGFRSTYAEGSKGVMIFDKHKKLMNAIETPFSPFKILLRN